MPYVPHRINSRILSMKYYQHWRGCHTSPKSAAVEVFSANGRGKKKVPTSQRIISSKGILTKFKVTLNRLVFSMLFPYVVNCLFVQCQFLLCELLLPSKIRVKPNIMPATSTHCPVYKADKVHSRSY